MSYGNLVRRPFEIVARRPYLWLLGILAGGATGFNLTGGGGRGFGPGGRGGSVRPQPSLAAVQSFLAHDWMYVVAALAVVAALGLVLFALGCIATGSIIHAALEHDAGREYRLGAAWRAGYGSAWRIAGLRILTFLLAIVPAFLVVALFASAVASAQVSAATAFGFGLSGVVTVLAAILFWVALSVAYQLAQRAVVLESSPVARSLSTGFRMLGAHLVEVGLGFLILFGLSIAAGIGGAILLAITAVPAVALGFAGWLAGGPVGAVVAGSFGAVFAAGVLVAAWGAYSAYSSVYWTLLYDGIRKLPAPAGQGAPVPA